MPESFHAERDVHSESQKAEWQTPVLQRLEAGSAEAGANPVQPEGLFQGS